MGAVSRATAEHYGWGHDCDGWHLLKRDDLSIIEERMPPGTAEVRHRHAQARQFFYVLAGEAEVELEGAVHALAAGQGMHVAPGQAHQLRNRSDRALHFLVVSAPNAHGDRVAAPVGGESAG